MKKLHFLLGAAALTLTACSNDEVVDLAQTQGIGFSTFVDKSTRATEDEDLNNTNLQTTGFAVWGVTWDDSKESEGVTTIFKDQEVKYDANGWTYAPLRYWIAGNEYRFSALAPYSATTDPNIMSIKQITDWTSFADAKGGLEFTFSNKAAAADIDLCFAKEKLENVSANQKPVDLVFSHMLSRVKFTFKNIFPSPQSVIRLSKINIEDASASGSINTYNGETTWTELTSEGTFAINFDKIALDDSNPQLIPGGTNTSQIHQQETEHHYLLSLTEAKAYKVNFTVELLTYDQETIKYNKIGEWDHKVTLPSTTFVPNYSYNFIAEISEKNINPEQQMYPIIFNPSVSEWGKWSDSKIDIPVNDTTTPDTPVEP